MLRTQWRSARNLFLILLTELWAERGKKEKKGKGVIDV